MAGLNFDQLAFAPKSALNNRMWETFPHSGDDFVPGAEVRSPDANRWIASEPRKLCCVQARSDDDVQRPNLLQA